MPPVTRATSLWGSFLLAAFLLLVSSQSFAQERRRTLLVPPTLGQPRNEAELSVRLQRLPRRTLQSLPLLQRSEWAEGLRAPGEGAIRLVDVLGNLLPAGLPVSLPLVRVLPVQPGTTRLRLRDGFLEVAVLSVELLRRGHATPHPVARASLSRSFPPELALSAASRQGEPDAFAARFRGPASALPSTVALRSFDAESGYLDTLTDLGLSSRACPDDTPSAEAGQLGCAETDFLRLVMDSVERRHPAVAHRSLVAEVGGHVALAWGDGPEPTWLVGAPLELPASRYRVRVRTTILRNYAGGKPAVGGDDSEAERIVEQELAAAAGVWGQCGVALPPRSEWFIQVVDPPPVTLVEVGCAGGTLASGGQLSLKVGGRWVSVRTRRGESPREVAVRFAFLLQKEGWLVLLDRNPKARSAAGPSYDLRVQDRAGRLLELSVGRAGVESTDRTLRLCPGEVDFADGLEHFSDDNAASGTLEERALLRAFMDEDPRTIDLFVVPVFSGLGRIGESFIRSSGGSIENVLILDRAGVRAGARSLTLAHELGHILLQMPGHPDDFGVDTPTSLMDADAADATIFGPRRMTIEDCRRALRQSGPAAPVVLLEEWPLPEALSETAVPQ